MKAIIATLLVCNVGGPGTARQAQPVIDKFIRHMEKAGGWSANTLRGAYTTSASRCLAAMRQAKPQIVVADLATFLRLQRRFRLKALAHMGTATTKRYYLLVRKGSYKNLAALKGKTLLTTFADDQRFLSKIIFRGRIAVARHFGVVKRARRPLRGIRKVARGRADATLVDEMAFKYLKELKLPAKLAAIHRSARLPGLTLAVTRHAKGDVARRIGRTLPRLCTGAGKALCKTFQIKTFGRANKRLYRKLIRRYR